MNKAEAHNRAAMIAECLQQLPPETNVLSFESANPLYDDMPATIHIYNPLPSFDIRERQSHVLVRYCKRIGDVCVFWLANEPVPEGV